MEVQHKVLHRCERHVYNVEWKKAAAAVTCLVQEVGCLLCSAHVVKNKIFAGIRSFGLASPCSPKTAQTGPLSLALQGVVACDARAEGNRTTVPSR